MKKLPSIIVAVFALWVVCATRPVYAQEAEVQAPKSSAALIDVLQVSGMDILDVIQLIVQETGLNIVVGQNVTGKAPVNLKNVEAKDALRIILEPNGLAYSEESGILRIMTAQDYEINYGHKFDESIDTKIIPLSFADSADISAIIHQMQSDIGKVMADGNTLILIDTPANIVRMEKSIKEADVQRFTMVFALSQAKAPELSGKVHEMLTKNIGKVRFDEPSNKLIVTDTASKIEEIRKLVEAIDQRDRPVSIEAKILQITLNDEHRMGVDWEAIVSNYHGVALDAAGDAPSGDKRGKLSIGTLSKDDYTVLLEALDTVGSVDVLSNPSIPAVNNKEARLTVGESQPYVTVAADSADVADAAFKLFVTPTVHADGFITMKIRPEFNAAVASEAVVDAKDGVTLVIGGLIKEEKTKTIKKVPILGDVPFLGVAFRSHSRTVKKTEIVIFLTPKLSTGDAVASVAQNSQ